ncbi:MAG: hypothetical protein QOJ12_2108 [Thermoleophilales bacterium]|nr:hypothetical protein [Thermoleophilales bacterium]
MLPAQSQLDLAGYRVLRTVGHSPDRDRAVRRFSALGEHALVWLAIGLAAAAADPARRERWARGTRGVAVAYGLNTALKLVVRRRRPDVPGLPPLTGTPTALSFPSAHATTSYAAARAYAPLLRDALGPGSEAPLWALAGALAASRLYLGVHYPSDVLVGAALGALIGGRAR